MLILYMLNSSITVKHKEKNSTITGQRFLKICLLVQGR